MDVAGGAGFYRTLADRAAYRDVRGARFHPFGPEETLVHAGLVALGLPRRRAVTHRPTGADRA